mgnify:CR=1 FL=1
MHDLRNSSSGAPPTRCVGESGVAELGMRRLQLGELAEQLVVLGIRNARIVEHVVAVVVRFDVPAQLSARRRIFRRPPSGEQPQRERPAG